MKTIDSFTESYRFLSNFYPAHVRFDGGTCPTVEHAYQASKTLDHDEQKTIIAADGPALAKKLGQLVKQRPHWDEIKFDIMHRLVQEKFTNPLLREWLLSTRNAILIEGNTWNDRVWGVCKGKGQNWLGKILMIVRREAWYEELKAVAIREYDFTAEAAQTLDRAAYLDSYYFHGELPSEALSEDFSNA